MNSPPLSQVSIKAIDLEQQNKFMQKIVDQMLEQVNQSFEQHISLAFAKLRTQISERQLYVLYEEALHCDAATDHRVPKNVLPLFCSFLDACEQLAVQFQHVDFRAYVNQAISDCFQIYQEQSTILQNQLILYERQNLNLNLQQLKLTQLYDARSSQLEHESVKLTLSSLIQREQQNNKSTVYEPDEAVFVPQKLGAQILKLKKEHQHLNEENRKMQIEFEKQEQQLKKQNEATQQKINKLINENKALNDGMREITVYMKELETNIKEKTENEERSGKIMDEIIKMSQIKDNELIKSENGAMNAQNKKYKEMIEKTEQAINKIKHTQQQAQIEKENTINTYNEKLEKEKKKYEDKFQRQQRKQAEEMDKLIFMTNQQMELQNMQLSPEMSKDNTKGKENTNITDDKKITEIKTECIENSTQTDAPLQITQTNESSIATDASLAQQNSQIADNQSDALGPLELSEDNQKIKDNAVETIPKMPETVVQQSIQQNISISKFGTKPLQNKTDKSKSKLKSSAKQYNQSSKSKLDKKASQSDVLTSEETSIIEGISQKLQNQIQQASTISLQTIQEVPLQQSKSVQVFIQAQDQMTETSVHDDRIKKTLNNSTIENNQNSQIDDISEINEQKQDQIMENNYMSPKLSENVYEQVLLDPIVISRMGSIQQICSPIIQILQPASYRNTPRLQSPQISQKANFDNITSNIAETMEDLSEDSNYDTQLPFVQVLPDFNQPTKPLNINAQINITEQEASECGVRLHTKQKSTELSVRDLEPPNSKLASPNILQINSKQRLQTISTFLQEAFNLNLNEIPVEQLGFALQTAFQGFIQHTSDTVQDFFRGNLEYMNQNMILESAKQVFLKKCNGQRDAQVQADYVEFYKRDLSEAIFAANQYLIQNGQAFQIPFEMSTQGQVIHTIARLQYQLREKASQFIAKKLQDRTRLLDRAMGRTKINFVDIGNKNINRISQSGFRGKILKGSMLKLKQNQSKLPKLVIVGTSTFQE
ncbi:Conserved_hypothetical protein [Hexamita inflata]|uniref:Uncharacterized protein n=1 Tax=Hexamita inflata TaxID=28002 RepID=A0AA86NZB4_9EUKA|nr:Conserved hypothetical protein [Hexamita inflata]CAI9928778.1 Conserved hypothetical protein [Hexamita inflata]